jgi:hypothetical protein
LERSSKPEGGGPIVWSAARCRPRFDETTAERQHEPTLCSAWIPRSRTQRPTIMEVRRRGTSDARVGLRAKVMERRCDRVCSNSTPHRNV